MSNWFRSPTSDVFFANFGNSSMAGGQTRYIGAGGVGFSITEVEVQFIMTRAGIIRFLTTQANVNTRPNATAVTLRKNAAATALVISIPAASVALFQNVVNVVSVIAGDRIAIQFVTPAGAGSLSDLAASFEFQSR